MSETKDPAIKLFGKTIPLPEITAPPVADFGGALLAPSADPPVDVDVDDGPTEDRPYSTDSSLEDTNSNRVGQEQELEKDESGGQPSIQDQSGGEPSNVKPEDVSQSLTSEEFTYPSAASVTNEDLKTPSVDTETATVKTSKTEEEQSVTSNSQEKTPKKPDKILPCPRCNSMDTKFCYYNNYNVNQPRHFCKNCQRYWTAGGTMRNVPVGAGRRKNKNSASHYHHIAVPEALQNSRADLPNGIHHPTLKPNGTVLTFGSETPLCESVVAALNIAEKTIRNCSLNGFHKPEELRIPVSYGSGDDGNDRSSGSSVTASSSKDEVGKTRLQDPMMKNCHNFPPQVPCFPAAPWPYPWNSAQLSSPVPPPAFFPAGFPMPFYPAAPYWGCTVPGTWNVPVVIPSTTSQNHTATTSGPNSPTLGKHSRDDNLLKSANSGEQEPQKENNPERSLWIPKTLRIDDPEEAARSSIWATLGIKNDNADSISGGGLFKAFQSKGVDKNHTSETSPLLKVNPAALSRSLNFHERS